MARQFLFKPLWVITVRRTAAWSILCVCVVMTKNTLTASFPVPDASQSKWASLIVAFIITVILLCPTETSLIAQARSFSRSLLSPDHHLPCLKQASGSYTAKGPIGWLVWTSKWRHLGRAESAEPRAVQVSRKHSALHWGHGSELGSGMSTSTRDAAWAVD